jgi:DNA-binding NarL/FixJ family response regulator/two-component sensor histidine kinase
MTVILIIEDEEDIRETLDDILNLDGYEVLHAVDGREGVRLARQHLPDLIISDILMPEMDGYEVFHELRRDIATAEIPFIFLSALSTYDNVREGMNIGVDDYLTKPFDYRQVSTAVSARLQRHIERDNMRLRQLNARLIQMQERDYKQVADLLTDVLGEPLKGLNLLLSMNANFEPNIIKDVHQVLEGLIEKTSAIALQLHPTMLEHLGMLSIVRWLSEIYHERYGLSVSFLHAGLQTDIPAATKIAIYRMLDEALLNVVQHAQVTEVEMQLRLKEGIITLDVIDSGVGFDVEQVLDEAQTTGLATLIARSKSLRGEINIRSIRAAGTHIQVQIPVSLETPTAVEDASTALTPPANTTPTTAPHTILLAEDHEIIRQGLRRLLEQNPTYHIVGEVNNGDMVLSFIREYQPALVILDMSIAGLAGMDILRAINKRYPAVKVLAFSPYKEEVYAREALKHGALGYILTESSSAEILQAVNAILAGQQYVTSILLFDGPKEEGITIKLEDEMTLQVELTEREREVLRLVAEGLTSAEIGERLSISRRTVEKHRSNLMKKLGIKNHMQLLAYAINQGLHLFPIR